MEKQRILVAIVLYNQTLQNSQAYISLIKNNDQWDGLYVYDNSPVAQDNITKFDKHFYFHDASNSGLSKAYNTMAEYASENKYKWILLSDQDTTFANGILEEYRKAIDKNPTIKLFAAKTKIESGKYISPAIYRHKISHSSNKAPSIGLLGLSNHSIINSGILINVDAFWVAGGYNEKIWLDYSDHEFIDRFKSLYKECYILDKENIQSFSVEEKDVTRLKTRYQIFCQCIKQCPKYTFFDEIEYLCLVIKRMLSLVIKTGNLSFFKLFIKSYLSWKTKK